MWRRRPVAPWEDIGGDVVVLHENSLHRLVGPAALLWQIADEPARESDLLAVLEKAGVDLRAAANALARLGDAGLFICNPRRRARR